MQSYVWHRWSTSWSTRSPWKGRRRTRGRRSCRPAGSTLQCATSKCPSGLRLAESVIRWKVGVMWWIFEALWVNDWDCAGNWREWECCQGLVPQRWTFESVALAHVRYFESLALAHFQYFETVASAHVRYLGEAHLALNDCEAAKADFERTFQLDPENKVHFFTVGFLSQNFNNVLQAAKNKITQCQQKIKAQKVEKKSNVIITFCYVFCVSIFIQKLLLWRTSLKCLEWDHYFINDCDVKLRHFYLQPLVIIRLDAGEREEDFCKHVWQVRHGWPEKGSLGEAGFILKVTLHIFRYFCLKIVQHKLTVISPDEAWCNEPHWSVELWGGGKHQYGSK